MYATHGKNESCRDLQLICDKNGIMCRILRGRIERLQGGISLYNGGGGYISWIYNLRVREA